MKVETKNWLLSVLEVFFAMLLFTFLFWTLGPEEEKVTVWLPDNYELENLRDGDSIIIPQKENEPIMEDVPVIYSSMRDFFILADFTRHTNKIKVSIIHDNPAVDYDIIYQINCATAADKRNFIVKTTYRHRCGQKHLSTTLVRFNQEKGILFLKSTRDWRAMFYVSSICLLCFVFWGLSFGPFNFFYRKSPSL